jgi:hypothetical protein
MPRIVVKVEQNFHTQLWRAVCHTEASNGQPCVWTSRAQVVKVAAEDEARYHREHHRRERSPKNQVPRPSATESQD